MLHTTISTKSPSTKEELPIPPDLMAGVTRASQVLEAELSELAERFDLGAEWFFEDLDANEVRVAHVSLTANGSLIGVFTFPPGALRNDETVRRNLRPFLTDVGRHLSGVVKSQLDALHKRIEDNIKELAALTKE